MANQTITTSQNHDALTGRLAGQDITIQLGAVLTIDSMPQHTAMGILGDVNITSGEINIDGRYVREIAYDTGSGTIPAVGAILTYGTAGTSKVIRLNSGDNVAGVMTITIQGPLEEPAGTITNGTWSATITTSKVGLLMIFGEDQIWDAVNATCTLRIRGDWHQIGVGTGADSQSITLPHSGIQHAIWVETGDGTNVFEIWHRVGTVASTVFFDAVADWGNTFETGFVFSHTPGTSTLNFGTSTNGGVPPNGARIRIPNVHIGTTTVAAPLVEYVGLVIGNYVEIVDSAVTENVFIDHLNASTVNVTLNQTNGATISDSAIGIWIAAGFIVRNNAPVILENCAFVPGNSLTDGGLALAWIVIDNLGGIEVRDCVFHGGVNGNNSGVVQLTTMANLTFFGRNKLVSNQQDENSHACLRGAVTSNIINEGLLLIHGGAIFLTAGCVNWQLGDIAYGQLTSRGATENNIALLSATGTDNVTIDSGRYLVGGGISPMRGSVFILTDSSNVVIQNFGDVDEKMNNGGFGAGLMNLAGITNNCVFRRVWYTGFASAESAIMINSVSDILIENCSGDYNDELELDANRVTLRGWHGASGNVDTNTGVEGDLVNVVATIFHDYFKSDTTGALGLLFNNRGIRHIPHVEIVSGNPIWNGLADMVMTTAGDQVIFTWPYSIKGHTAFQDAARQIAAVNPNNFGTEYDLDTGSGFSGTWQTVNGANLSAESISAAGFGIKIRVTCLTSATNNAIRGFAILTNTTIAAQKANLYPADARTITLTGLQPNSEVRLYLGTTADPLAAIELDGVENSGTSVALAHSNAGSAAYIVVAHVEYENFIISIGALLDADQSIPVQQRFDRNFNNP